MNETEFIRIIFPIFEELRYYCFRMTADEFLEYKNSVLAEVEKLNSLVAKKFIMNCLDLIHNDIE